MRKKDLGAIVHKSLKPGRHVSEIVKKANKTLGILSRTLTFKEREILLPLYKSLVRPVLEYCSPAWNPHLRQDVNLLEKVQRRFSRMVPDVRHLPYEQRLDDLGLMSLEMRRFRADLIETFRVIKGLEDIKSSSLFEKRYGVTRGHGHMIFKGHCKLNTRKYFFTQRVINAWNKLPPEAVDCNSINMFKSFLTKDRLRHLMGDYMSL